MSQFGGPDIQILEGTKQEAFRSVGVLEPETACFGGSLAGLPKQRPQASKVDAGKPRAFG